MLPRVGLPVLLNNPDAAMNFTQSHFHSMPVLVRPRISPSGRLSFDGQLKTAEAPQMRHTGCCLTEDRCTSDLGLAAWEDSQPLTCCKAGLESER